MSECIIEAEVGYYWRVASEARRIRREDASRPTDEQQGDLKAIVINSDWPKLRIAAQSVLAELAGPIRHDQEEQACESSA